MSKCEVKILFDRPDGIYKFGEAIAGVVQVAAHADFHCRQITLIRGWKTHGRGNIASGGEEGLILADAAEFKTGETRDYPFRFAELAGPVSYQGHYLSVEWHVRAHLDIPLAVDVKQEEKFILAGGETSQEILLGTGEEVKINAKISSELEGRIAMAKVLGVPFFIIGLAMIYFSAWYPLTLALGLAATGFGGWQIFLMVRNKLAQKKLGEIEVRIHPDKLRPGNQLECSVALPSSHAQRLQKITATLIGEERVVSGAGNHKMVHTYKIHEQVTEETAHQAVDSANKLQFNLPLQLPAEAPSTFHAPDNALFWFVLVHCDIRGWPDWVQEFPITVMP
jgi:hypothetical protein